MTWERLEALLDVTAEELYGLLDSDPWFMTREESDMYETR